jgi:hypothetical protein
MIHFHRDPAGVFRATGEPLLAEFFMDEIQGDPDRLALYEAKAAGPDWRATGNAHRVEIGAGEVAIEALLGAPPAVLRLSLTEFRRCLARCRQFLDQES